MASDLDRGKTVAKRDAERKPYLSKNLFLTSLPSDGPIAGHTFGSELSFRSARHGGGPRRVAKAAPNASSMAAIMKSPNSLAALACA